MMSSLIRVYREDAPQPNVSNIVTRFDKNQRKIVRERLKELHSDVRHYSTLLNLIRPLLGVQPSYVTPDI